MLQTFQPFRPLFRGFYQKAKVQYFRWVFFWPIDIPDFRASARGPWHTLFWALLLRKRFQKSVYLISKCRQRPKNRALEVFGSRECFWWVLQKYVLALILLGLRAKYPRLEMVSRLEFLMCGWGLRTFGVGFAQKSKVPEKSRKMDKIG